MKKSKKFVLAALVLLAITGLLALAGCKNDSVSETPAAKLVSISVTPSEGTVYKVGDEVVHKKDGEIGVTAHYDNGRTSPVTGTITTDTSTLTQSAGVETVTVRYSEGGIEVSGQFEIRVLPKELTDYESPNKTGSEWTYMEFGEWPQNEAPGVDPTLVDPQPENLFKGKYYSDANGEYVKVGDKYYKVEPIVWRVLTTSYEAPEGGTVGEILLLAEKILTGGVPYYDVYNVNRTVGEATIYPNNYEHSAVRAWLNGLEYLYKGPDDDVQIEKGDYFGKGFLQTAFTESAQKLIELTSVDNSDASTFGTGESTQENPYAYGKTKDKIFLLSQQEATTLNSGFGAYDDVDSTRIRVTTDYAEATGAYQDSTPGYGGWWWLRSPYCLDESYARFIYSYGDTFHNCCVNNTDGGVVPALSISLQ